MHNRVGWDVQFAYRECNNVDHLLAKEGLISIGEKIWIKDCPQVILGEFLHDRQCID